MKLNDYRRLLLEAEEITSREAEGSSLMNELDSRLSILEDLFDFEADPFSTALMLIAGALEGALDDGVSGSMNARELETLEKIATIVTQDGGMPVEPRIA